MATQPENLNIYLTNGFNARYFDFIGGQVFVEPTYSVPVNFGPYDKTYDFPEGVQFNGGSSFMNFSDDESADMASNFEQKFSVGISAGGKVKRWTMGAEASLSSKIATTAKLGHATTERRFFSFAVQTIYQIERDTSPSTTSTFATAIGGLPTSLATTAELEQYETFFNQYGTHYLVRGSLGGYFMVQTDVDKALVESASAAAISGALSASFNAAVASGSLSIETALEKSQYLKDNLEGTKSRYSCRGGTFDTDLHNWVVSCFRNPILVPGIAGINEPILKPLSELAPAAVKPVMDQALRSYLAAKRYLGPPQPVTLATPATASSSGFLIASLTAAADSTTHADLKALAGADQTLTAGCGSVDGARGLNAASILVPLNGGDEYDCVLSSSTTAPGTSAVFLPVSGVLGDGPCFAAPVPLNLNKPSEEIPSLLKIPFIPPSDGLLVCVGLPAAIYCSVAVLQNLDGKDVVLGGCMGGADNSSVSCAIPVQGGIEYAVVLNNWNAGDYTKYNVNFVALQNGLQWGKRRMCAIGNRYTASSDGLATGVATTYQASSAPPTVSISINVAESLSTMGSPVYSGGASVYCTGPNPWQSMFNSVTVPVRKGQVFQPTCSVAGVPSPVTDGEVGATFTFYPLEEISGLGEAVAQIATKPN